MTTHHIDAMHPAEREALLIAALLDLNACMTDCTIPYPVDWNIHEPSSETDLAIEWAKKREILPLQP